MDLNRRPFTQESSVYPPGLSASWRLQVEKSRSNHFGPDATAHGLLQWNQAKMWLFLNNFSASTNWFWLFETLLEQSLSCLLFPEWNRIGIFCGNGGKNCPSPIWGDFWGKRGSGKNHFSGRAFSRLARLQWIPFVLRKTLFDFIKSCGGQIRLKFSEVALLGLLYSPK